MGVVAIVERRFSNSWTHTQRHVGVLRSTSRPLCLTCCPNELACRSARAFLVQLGSVPTLRIFACSSSESPCLSPIFCLSHSEVEINTPSASGHPGERQSSLGGQAFLIVAHAFMLSRILLISSSAEVLSFFAASRALSAARIFSQRSPEISTFVFASVDEVEASACGLGRERAGDEELEEVVSRPSRQLGRREQRRQLVALSEAPSRREVAACCQGPARPESRAQNQEGRPSS